ncbi:MAG: TonB-dependent receptor [Ignavibacteriaceae bacterium]|jgi:iron complex outermembrane receptor protein|nr:TonB-dependent receptor [Ignavibacteriaceae bacterium]MCW8813328.1 TonB-dependent receptor [Chlorobium sp.]MCW8995247.1 TonB-dependent receptor [Psychromonas sp.]MCW8816532.1 TonB-dependent receptor [Ignavibacteriaceae bacterium]MCW8824568.1 TonB-dependent receptor [Ignavibacteriaceae bacterium]
MKNLILSLFVLFYVTSVLKAQNENADTLKNVTLQDVIVKANRLPITLKSNPGSISIVTPEMITLMPKTIGAEEALRLVPGVRIDNQHGGERVHISIRGQGILTERGLRGIGVMLDGIPVNDPSGFAPDLYDVDWPTVKNIQVLRGPAAGLYGCGSSAGILYITTNDGGSIPIEGEYSQVIGSNKFFKELAQVDGTQENINYRLSFSREDGDGYRDHQAFWGNKLYEKINFTPSDKLRITQIVSHTDYFHQNPEGLNRQQFDNLKQANPDANPFNEYQKTNRTTLGLFGSYTINEMNDFEVTPFYRYWNYKETSNKAAEYRNITNPGVSAQYNLHLTSGNVMNNFSVGTDLKWQNIGMYKLQSGSDPNRVESTDETNIETDSLLANQIIYQQSTGLFALYKLDVEKFNLIGSIRYDNITNELTDKMVGLDSSKTTKDFSKPSYRVGASYGFLNEFNLFASWSTGFIPPSTEELANNPVGYSGFNTHLTAATSNSFEIGARGFFSDKLYYELTGFIMDTENDFFRFKQSGRGNQEVFYGNAGNSKRYGIETFISYNILHNLSLQLAYTYADYRYTSATVDPVYTDTNYVLTTPPAEGQYLPNSPKHQLYSEVAYSPIKSIRITLSGEYQSKWAIYTDAKAYNNELDPEIYQNWQDGFTKFNAEISYLWDLGVLNGALSLSVRNFTDEQYMAFTEPDPDGNSYQPGPGREFFGNLRIKF